MYAFDIFLGKASACNGGDPGLIPGSGRSPGEENCNPLLYSCLENPKDRGAWWATVHGVAKRYNWATSLSLSDSVLKSKDTTLLTKVCIVKAMVFPVVMYGCESWIIKKAEHWRIGPSNCGAGEDPWESLGQQGDQNSQSQRISTLNIHWKFWC